MRKVGKIEKYLPKNVIGKRQDGGISQMIWGCFMGNKLGPIVFIDENINVGVYTQILDQNLLQYIKALAGKDIHDIVFQQDNAHPHVAKVTQHWLENMGREYRFTVMR